MGCIPVVVPTESLGCLLIPLSLVSGSKLILPPQPKTAENLAMNFRGFPLSFLASCLWHVGIQHIPWGGNSNYLAHFFVASFSPKSWLLRCWLPGRQNSNCCLFSPVRLLETVQSSLPLANALCPDSQPLTLYQESVNTLRENWQNVDSSLCSKDLGPSSPNCLNSSPKPSSDVVCTLAFLAFFWIETARAILSEAETEVSY